MSDQDIFQETPVVAPVEVSTEVLVGEGKKYATVDELAKAYYNADGFIDTPKEENRVLREQVAIVAELDATLLRMQQAKESSTQTDQSEVEQPQAVNADHIAKLVEDTLVKREQTNVLKNNLKVADEKLKAVFGDKAKEVFDAQTSNPALRTTLTTLAQTDPDAFVNYFVNITGVKAPQIQGVAGEQKVNTINLQSVHGNRENDPSTSNYYSNLRKTNPTLYYSQETQIAMQKAALANPDKYFN